MKKLTLVLCALIATGLLANEITLKQGDVHLNERTGTFAAKLNGNYTIVLSVDYENESMSATVIDNSTGKIHTLPVVEQKEEQ